jgi:hypothetical protein
VEEAVAIMRGVVGGVGGWMIGSSGQWARIVDREHTA